MEEKKKNHKLYRDTKLFFFFNVVLHSEPNGFSFLFSHELSSVARGTDLLKAGRERGWEREVGARSWLGQGGSNASLHSPNSEARELSLWGGEREGTSGGNAEAVGGGGEARRAGGGRGDRWAGGKGNQASGQ